MPPETENQQELREYRVEPRSRLRDIAELINSLTESESEDFQARLYMYYSTAMKLRNRECLGENAFCQHFFAPQNMKNSKIFGNEKDGYLLGEESKGVFVPTHFAPANLKGGYRLVQELVKDELPVALFITLDLVKTIKKIPGWKVMPLTLKLPFRGKLTEKKLVINHWSALPRLLAVQLEDMQQEQQLSTLSWRVRQLINGIRKKQLKKTLTHIDLEEEFAQTLEPSAPVVTLDTLRKGTLTFEDYNE